MKRYSRLLLYSAILGVVCFAFPIKAFATPAGPNTSYGVGDMSANWVADLTNLTVSVGISDDQYVRYSNSAQDILLVEE